MACLEWSWSPTGSVNRVFWRQKKSPLGAFRYFEVEGVWRSTSVGLWPSRPTCGEISLDFSPFCFSLLSSPASRAAAFLTRWTYFSPWRSLPQYQKMEERWIENGICVRTMHTVISVHCRGLDNHVWDNNNLRIHLYFERYLAQKITKLLSERTFESAEY